MKVAICLYKYFPYGGLQRDCLQIIHEFITRGHEVRVYCMAWEAQHPQEVELILIKKRGMLNYQRYRYFSQQMNLHLQDHPVDVVIGFNKMPGLDFYFAADPCYADRLRGKRQRYSALLNPRGRHLLKFEECVFNQNAATKIAYLSESQKRAYQQKYQTGDSRFRLMPPGLDSKRLILNNRSDIRCSKRQELGFNGEQPLLLFLGSNFKVKGLDRVLKLLIDRPLLNLIVIGDDNPSRYWKTVLKNKLHKRIIFLGPREDISEWMVACDCMVHPAYVEAGGIVLLEAIGNGLAVVTTDSCGFSQYVLKSQMGVVLKSPYKQDDLNCAVDCILQEDRTLWLQHSQQFLQKCNIFHLAKKFTDWVEETTASRRVLK